jgi:RNA polymerase sigma-70 factor (ECF subfamily)
LIAQLRAWQDARSMRARARDPGFLETAQSYAPVLASLAVRLTGNEADASDLVQDTYERALRAYERLPADANVRAWLIAILHNLFIDRCRRARRAPRMTELLPDTAASPPDPEPPPAWTNVTREEVTAALDKLDPTFRRVYELHAVEGRSYQEIAEALGIPKNTVGTRLIRARKKLKAILTGGSPEEDPE